MQRLALPPVPTSTPGSRQQSRVQHGCPRRDVGVDTSGDGSLPASEREMCRKNTENALGHGFCHGQKCIKCPNTSKIANKQYRNTTTMASYSTMNTIPTADVSEKPLLSRDIKVNGGRGLRRPPEVSVVDAGRTALRQRLAHVPHALSRSSPRQ